MSDCRIIDFIEHRYRMGRTVRVSFDILESKKTEHSKIDFERWVKNGEYIISFSEVKKESRIFY